MQLWRSFGKANTPVQKKLCTIVLSLRSFHRIPGSKYCFSRIKCTNPNSAYTNNTCGQALSCLSVPKSDYLYISPPNAVLRPFFLFMQLSITQFSGRCNCQSPFCPGSVNRTPAFRRSVIRSPTDRSGTSCSSQTLFSQAWHCFSAPYSTIM